MIEHRDSENNASSRGSIPSIRIDKNKAVEERLKQIENDIIQRGIESEKNLQNSENQKNGANMNFWKFVSKVLKETPPKEKNCSFLLTKRFVKDFLGDLIGYV
ncbi:hypothetical protein BB558_003113 [Smittium angustum]|uniref:Uncharacterized protein n=1 Tax=Smittium angustum TaxID=133377 RepID=A0A2U1J779_SMIAN|nr:hypothetical protein BB558_003113 [Smittium angustum]